MAGVDPVTAVAEAIKEIAAAIKLAFNGQNRKILSDVKRLKRMQKALNVAEEIFMETDIVMPKENKKYIKLRKEFSKND